VWSGLKGCYFLLPPKESKQRKGAGCAGRLECQASLAGLSEPGFLGCKDCQDA
jgi:hypothetical protein